MDLSVTASGAGIKKDGKLSDKVKESGTFMQSMTVTNNSDETATGVVLETDLQAGLDVWEPGQETTEFGTS